jgi:hypothetical protein
MLACNNSDSGPAPQTSADKGLWCYVMQEHSGFFFDHVCDYELPVLQASSMCISTCLLCGPLWPCSAGSHHRLPMLQQNNCSLVSIVLSHMLSSAHLDKSAPMKTLRFSPHQADTTFVITVHVQSMYATMQRDQAIDTVCGHVTNTFCREGSATLPSEPNCYALPCSSCSTMPTCALTLMYTS